MTFIGREKELSVLEECYTNYHPRHVAVRGRRRIGKTSLLYEFCKDKRHLFITFIRAPLARNIEQIEEAVSEQLGYRIRTDNLTAVFSDLVRICKDGKTVVVMDEYPYFIEDNPNLSTYTQRFVDRVQLETDSMVVICGSAISTMRNEVENEQRPLYSRFRKLQVGELDIGECAEFHPEMSDMDLLKTYLTVGGVPAYHYCNARTYEEFMNRQFLSENAPLETEGRRMVFLDMGTDGKHEMVVEAVASGDTSTGDVANRTQISQSRCGVILRDLLALSIVGTDTPMAGAGKHPRYRITDPVVDLHYSVLSRINTHALLDDDPESNLSQRISSFLGKRFKLYCEKWVYDNYPCRKVGKWWGKLPRRNTLTSDRDLVSTDIDVVADLEVGNMKGTVFAECKFRRSPVSYTELNELERKVKLVSRTSAYTLMLMSAGGFSEDVLERAGPDGILLVGLDELVGRQPAPGL